MNVWLVLLTFSYHNNNSGFHETFKLACDRPNCERKPFFFSLLKKKNRKRSWNIWRLRAILIFFLSPLSSADYIQSDKFKPPLRLVKSVEPICGQMFPLYIMHINTLPITLFKQL